MPAPTRPKHVDILQAMRAVAAILVMLFHLTRFLAEDFGLLAFGNLFAHGESGVDIFFVISGFVIYHSTKARKSPGRLEFVVSRLIRIFPIYWLVMLALVLAEGLGLTRNPERLDPATIAVSALLLPSREYVLNIAWTLSIELIYYLYFCMTFFRSERLYFIGLAAWSCFAIVGTDRISLQVPYAISNFVLYSGIAEFFFGSVLAWLYARAVMPLGLVALILGSGAFVLSLSGWTGSMLPKLGREFAFGLPAVLAMYGLLALRFRAPRLLTRLGDSSYLLYLLHGTVLSVAIKVVVAALGAAALAYWPVLILIGIAPVAAAALGTLYIEQPLIRTFKGLPVVRRLTQPAAAGARSG